MSGSGAPGPDPREVERARQAEEAADALMARVRELRSDERAWADVAAWRALLRSEALQRRDARDVFRSQLLAFLEEQGQGLGGPAWQVLESRFRWSREAPAADLARAARVLGPAMVEAIETASPPLPPAEVVARLAPVVGHAEGPPGERARQIFEQSCGAALERAEELERDEQYPQAIEEAAPVARSGTGEVAAWARDLVERGGRAVLEEAGRLREARQFEAAVQRLAPVADHLPPPLRLEVRLLLARCHLALGSWARAEEPLEAALREEPASVRALLHLAAVKEASGQQEPAAAACLRVLDLDPGNEDAQARLRRIQGRGQAEGGLLARRRGRSLAALWPIGLVLCLGLLFWLSSWGSGGKVNLEGLDRAKAVATALASAALVALGLAVGAWRRGRESRALEDDVAPPPGKSSLLFAAAAAVLAVAGLFVWPFDRSLPASLPRSKGETRPRGVVPSSRASRPPAVPRRVVPPADVPWPYSLSEVSILSLDPEELPLHQGRTVGISARVRYNVSSGRGRVKLLAVARPGGATVEIASREVHERFGTVVVSGRYRVPADATRVEIAVPIFSGSGGRPNRTATATLAVEP